MVIKTHLTFYYYFKRIKDREYDYKIFDIKNEENLCKLNYSVRF